MSKSHFSHAGNKLTGTLQNHGISLQGNSFQGSVYFGNNKDDAEKECKDALFRTNPRLTEPIDDRGYVTDTKPKLVSKVCEWIHADPSFKTWIDPAIESQLLWISGASGMGKTMMSLFLLRELERNPEHARHSTILFYFVDTRHENRNTAVSIIRGLIHLLLRSRPWLISHLMSDYENQKETLFSQTSLEALWRIFQAMVKDPTTGRVYCLIDGLDECKEDSLQLLVRKVSVFFEEQQHLQEQAKAGNQNPLISYPIASLKIMLVSREAPVCLPDNLGRFPHVKVGGRTTHVSQTSAATTSKSEPKLSRKATKGRANRVPKLSTIAQLAVQKAKLERESDKRTVTNMMPTSVQTTPLDVEGVERDVGHLCLTASGKELKLEASATEHLESTPALQPKNGTLTPNESYTHDLKASEGVQTLAQAPQLTDQHLGDEYIFDDEVEEDEDDYADEAGYAAERFVVADGDGDEDLETTTQQVQSIIIYIEEKVAELSQDRAYSDELQASVMSGLLANGDGTFLWVDLAIEELKRCGSQNAEHVVQQLLPAVDDMYCRVVQRIPANMVQLAVTILRWVIAARRPLTVFELSAALTLIGFSSHNPVEMTGQGIAICGALLSIGENDSVHITHASVKDFLTATSGPLWTKAELNHFHVNVKDVDGEIASHCLRYLEQGCLNDGAVSDQADKTKFNQRLMQFPLLFYAIFYWPEHLRSATRPHISLSSPFFAKKSKVRKAWWNSYYPVMTDKNPLLTTASFTLLHMAAYLDLPFIANQLLLSGELLPRLNSKDSHGSTPLALAAANGNMDMFIFLTQHQASHEVPGESVFELACRKGQVEIARYLLDLGYNVDLRAREIDIVQAVGLNLRWIHGSMSEGLLLDRDQWCLLLRDIGGRGTPLHMASLFGYTSLVELLLSRGADVHAATTKRWTALHSAAWTGQTDCVKMLLERGARAMDVTDFGWNPMHCAASRGKATLVSFFIELGMPVDGLTVKYKSNLHLAAYTGNVATMKVLCKAGAAVDRQSYKGETPLHLATRQSNPEAVEMLLTWGANRMIVNGSGATAADTLKMIKGNLSPDNQEVLRILETFGLPGYIPWRPKTTPQAPATNNAVMTEGEQRGGFGVQASAQYTSSQYTASAQYGYALGTQLTRPNALDVSQQHAESGYPASPPPPYAPSSGRQPGSTASYHLEHLRDTSVSYIPNLSTDQQPLNGETYTEDRKCQMLAPGQGSQQQQQPPQQLVSSNSSGPNYQKAPPVWPSLVAPQHSQNLTPTAPVMPTSTTLSQPPQAALRNPPQQFSSQQQQQQQQWTGPSSSPATWSASIPAVQPYPYQAQPGSGPTIPLYNPTLGNPQQGSMPYHSGTPNPVYGNPPSAYSTYGTHLGPNLTARTMQFAPPPLAAQQGFPKKKSRMSLGGLFK